MQEKNRTFQRPPREGDGTQPAAKEVPEANWYGAAHEPQEEFIQDDPHPEKPASEGNEPAHEGKTSEGRPTFNGSGESLPPHAKESLGRPDK